MRKNYRVLGLVALIFFPIQPKNTMDDQQGKPGKIAQITAGNFALPTSQQPGPLIAFGQNIVDAGDRQLFAYVDYLKGHKKKYAEVVPSLLYGITDRASVFLALPIAAQFWQDCAVSHGLEDLFVQLEYALYAHNTDTAADQITLVGNIAFPTGSLCKTPNTGVGAVSFFLGATASHTDVQWYLFCSSGFLLTTPDHDTKIGNQFLYQFGISRNISYRADGWILNWMVELDGVYKQRNIMQGICDPNSGGNILLLGPSIWFSTPTLILQLGISWVVAQHQFGTQPRDAYYAAVDVGWKF